MDENNAIMCHYTKQFPLCINSLKKNVTKITELLRVISVLQSIADIIIIIVVNEFHRDASLKQNFIAAVLSHVTLVSTLLLPIMCIAV